MIVLDAQAQQKTSELIIVSLRIPSRPRWQSINACKVVCFFYATLKCRTVIL